MLRDEDLCFTAGNALELYRDGESGLRAMLEAIVAAHTRIHLETYILHSDTTGRRFIDALAERAADGIEVRLLIDAVGSRGIDSQALQALRDAGADVVVFNPLPRLYPRWAPRRRDHRKILIVDGEQAFTGGLNIGDEYALGVERDGSRVPWRDAHLRVNGPAVQALEAVFLESWFRADGPDRPAGGQRPGPTVPTVDGAVGVVADGPTYHRRRMRELVVRALAEAQQIAWFATPYFAPGRRIRRALADAAARGVDVRILVAGLSDHPLYRWAARARLPPLLEAGIRVFEFEEAMMHAKLGVFDASLAVIGTSNLERQSLQHSYEVNLAVTGGAIPTEVREMLESDFGNALEISPALLANRSWIVQMRDRVAAALVALT
jgi:cardiolipin synthase